MRYACRACWRIAADARWLILLTAFSSSLPRRATLPYTSVFYRRGGDARSVECPRKVGVNRS